jgi:hypothetical protein
MATEIKLRSNLARIFIVILLVPWVRMNHD